jgi:hypothetical protein
MNAFLIRNDDVAYDTDINEIRTFCDICDKHGFKIIQAITLIGECRKARATMTNDQIVSASHRLFKDNQEVMEYLKSRNDLIAVHGLWHTHVPTDNEIWTAKLILEGMGLKPTYFVPPFNEYGAAEYVHELKVCKLSMGEGERLEDFLESGTPTKPIMYLHSWRFNNDWYTFEQLDQCLKRLSN